MLSKRAGFLVTEGSPNLGISFFKTEQRTDTQKLAYAQQRTRDRHQSSVDEKECILLFVVSKAQ